MDNITILAEVERLNVENRLLKQILEQLLKIVLIPKLEF